MSYRRQQRYEKHLGVVEQRTVTRSALTRWKTPIVDIEIIDSPPNQRLETHAFERVVTIV